MAVETIDWHDDEGWTQEMLLWMMAWIEVCEEHSLDTNEKKQSQELIDAQEF